MANSVQYAKTQDTPSVKISTTELHGRVRVAYADFTAACSSRNYQYVQATRWC